MIDHKTKAFCSIFNFFTLNRKYLNLDFKTKVVQIRHELTDEIQQFKGELNTLTLNERVFKMLESDICHWNRSGRSRVTKL